MTTHAFRETLFVAGLSFLAALAGCNDSHLVQGAKCSSGVTAAPANAEPPAFRTVLRRPVSGPHLSSTGSSQLAATAPDAVPASASQLLDAMEVTAALAADGGGTVASSTLVDADARQAAAFQGIGVLHPTNGNSFAWLASGIAGAGSSKSLDASLNYSSGAQDDSGLGGAGCSDESGSNDCAKLTFSFVAPADAHSVAFDFNFMSTEYPEWVGSDYNDSFRVSLSSPSNNFANIVHDNSGNEIDINSVFFDSDCSHFSGTGFGFTDPLFGWCDASGTGLLTTTAPITPGETVTMSFEVYDMTDDVLDSAVMIDNFRFNAQPVGTPTTGTPTPTPAISPTPTPADSPTPTPTPLDSPTPTPAPTPECTN